MTVDEMKEKKRQLGYSSEKLAELSGVPLGTVQKIFGGFTKAPRYKTLQSLEKVFVEAEQKEDLSTGSLCSRKAECDGWYMNQRRHIYRREERSGRIYD